jgi:Rne/Rng family ribonuclease
MRKQALINVEETDIRVAMLEDGVLVELFIEDLHSRSKIGNIYKGRVEGIVPGLKAVFVDIGCAKNAFLHFSDVLAEFELPQRGRPERARRPPVRAAARVAADAASEDDEYIEPLYTDGESAATSEEELEDAEAGPQKRLPRRSRPLRVGDEMLVQVTKEEINDKGPRVTTYISLPGRYLVLMPFSSGGGGVSRRIEDMGERKRLRALLRALAPDNGSFIIRTAGLEQDEEAIRKDAEHMQRLWPQILRRASRCRAPARVHDDQEILTRVMRDNFGDDLDEILIDSKPAMRSLVRACQELVPSLCERIHYFESSASLFDTFEVEKQFEKALKRKVWLRSGGAIVIDETEAMTAIDVNSGKYVGHDDQDQVILKTNLEACRVIARQLRLRDLGGLIVIDLIDMNVREHEQQVLREMKRCLRADRAKWSLSDFSEFGLVEMTRKRVRRSLASAFYRPCPHCEGSGRVLSEAQLWKQLKYDLIAALEKQPVLGSVDIVVHSNLKTYMQANVVETLGALAGKYGVALHIVALQNCHNEHIEIVTHAKSVIEATAGAPSEPDVAAAAKGRKRGRKPAEKKLESASAAQDNALT